MRRVEAQGHTVEVGPDDGTVLVEDVGTHRPIPVLVTSVCAKVIVLNHSITEHLILPIGIDGRIVDVLRIVIGLTYEIRSYPSIYTFIIKYRYL